MAAKKFVLIVYDISNDKRRTKLHDGLLDFGTPVQYSVFECLLDADGMQRMKKAVMKVIRKKVDRVRFYTLCQDCLAKTEITSGVAVLTEQPAAIVS